MANALVETLPQTDGFQGNTRPGYVKKAIENMAIEIVDLPSYKMVDLSMVMLVYWRVYTENHSL